MLHISQFTLCVYLQYYTTQNDAVNWKRQEKFCESARKFKNMFIEKQDANFKLCNNYVLQCNILYIQ